MKNIKMFLDSENVDYEEVKGGGHNPYLKFMMGSQMYLVTDYGKHYDLETINQDMHFETKTQKAMVMILTNLKAVS